jgi:hypothetical protein
VAVSTSFRTIINNFTLQLSDSWLSGSLLFTNIYSVYSSSFYYTLVSRYCLKLEVSINILRKARDSSLRLPHEWNSTKNSVCTYFIFSWNYSCGSLSERVRAHFGLNMLCHYRYVKTNYSSLWNIFMGQRKIICKRPQQSKQKHRWGSKLQKKIIMQNIFCRKKSRSSQKT